MIYARNINAYRKSDNHLVVELPHESIDLPYALVNRDGEVFALLDDAVLMDLYSRDDVSVSPKERAELECHWCELAKQAE